MSDRPTPETDALADSRIGMWQYHLPADFARKMERERDAAISRFESSQHARMELKRERDEARELARELRDALKKCAGVCSGEVMNKNSLINALESAKSALTKAKEILP